MIVAIYLIGAALVAGNLYWIAIAFLSFWAMRSTRVLKDLTPPVRDKWPKVSIVVPACNEAATLRTAMATKLELDYPELEFILVDDRSSDGTADIVDEFARRDPRVRALHITELPAGWLGKLNALQKGLDSASGDWILFTDADVHVAPETLRTAIAWCEDRGLEHVAAIPQFTSSTFWLDSVLVVFMTMICTSANARLVENPRSRVACGSGSFNLVRRTALEKTPGLQWIRLDVADDVSLGRMLKEFGARSSVVSGRGTVKVKFYSSVPDMARGSEKNTFVVLGRCSPARLIGFAFVLCFMNLSPFLSLLFFAAPAIQLFGVITASLQFALSWAVARWAGARTWPALAAPIATIVFVVFMLRGAWLGYRRGGVQWRDTFYPSRTLREGQRYFYP